MNARSARELRELGAEVAGQLTQAVAYGDVQDLVGAARLQVRAWLVVAGHLDRVASALERLAAGDRAPEAAADAAAKGDRVGGRRW